MSQRCFALLSLGEQFGKGVDGCIFGEEMSHHAREQECAHSNIFFLIEFQRNLETAAKSAFIGFANTPRHSAIRDAENAFHHLAIDRREFAVGIGIGEIVESQHLSKTLYTFIAIGNRQMIER